MKDTNLKGYVLKSKIGSGGMAEVWLAQNTIGKQVAIKIMHQKFIDEAQVVQRFKNEAKATAKLDHPNIRQVIDFGVHENRPYIIQEYLEGKVLSECKGALDELTLQLIWTKSLEGLEYAHSKGIIHRDIKPSNLFLTIHNQLKIVDFGIAKVKDEISITGTGQALGSVLYMSPEQIKDPKRVTTSTDIYSLGITMLHLINGKQPFDASTSAFALQQNIVSGNYSTDDIPAKWVSVVIPCLNKEPENRPTISALLGNFNTKENRVLKKEEETIINGTNNSNNQSKKQKVTKNIAVENLSWFGYYIKGFKNYFNFKGRARRQEFWFFYLFSWVFLFGFSLIHELFSLDLFYSPSLDLFYSHSLDSVDSSYLDLFYVLKSLLYIASVIPSLSLTVRRIHDSGKSGWFVLVPVYSFILMFIDSEQGTNKYGENPKGQ